MGILLRQSDSLEQLAEKSKTEILKTSRMTPCRRLLPTRHSGSFEKAAVRGVEFDSLTCPPSWSPRFCLRKWGPRNTRKDAKGEESVGWEAHVTSRDPTLDAVDALLRDPAWHVQ